MKLYNYFFKSENGNVSIVVALLMTAFMAISAMVIDIGIAYDKQSVAQNTADSAVLAAGSLLPVNVNDTTKKQQIYNTAKEYCSKNNYLNITDNDIELTESDGKITRIDITKRITIPTYFGKVIGLSNINAPISSAVKAVPSGSMKGLVPIGINQDELNYAISNGQTKHITLKYGGGGGTGGNFGYIFLDGSSTGGAPDFKRWMAYGYEGTIHVGQELYQKTGNINSAVMEGCEYRFSQCKHQHGGTYCTAENFVPGCPLVIMILVYDNSGNADVKVTGFAPFVIEDYTNKGEIIGSYVGSLFPSSEVEGENFFGAVSISLVK